MANGFSLTYVGVRPTSPWTGGRQKRTTVKIDRHALSPKNNNLTAVRVLLASAVIWTHSIWNRTGVGGQDQVSGLLGQPLSVFAVDGFFFLSGFLVYASLLRRANVGDFLLARLARLWPALAVSVFVTVAAGAVVTSSNPSTYLGGATLKFIASNLSLTFANFFPHWRALRFSPVHGQRILMDHSVGGALLFAAGTSLADWPRSPQIHEISNLAGDLMFRAFHACAGR